MQRDIQELKNLPLEALITAPLNAVIAGQASAAMSTVQFVEKVGFISKDPRKSIFDKKTAADVSDVRIADLKVKRKRRTETGALVEDEVEVSLPYITLFNIPSLEVSSMDWSFNVKLNSIEEFSVDFTHSVETTSSLGVEAGGSLDSLGIPINIGSKMNVSVTESTQFDLRYGSGREQEYNLAITIRANQAPQPRGIQRLLDIAEKIAAANAEATKPLPATTPGGATPT